MEKHDMISEVKETTDQRQVWANCSKQTIRHRLYGSTYYIICFFLGFGFDSGPNLQPFNSWWNFDEQDLYSTLDADLEALQTMARNETCRIMSLFSRFTPQFCCVYSEAQRNRGAKSEKRKQAETLLIHGSFSQSNVTCYVPDFTACRTDHFA